ncbi:hypothetical protein HHUSO_G32752 [Huso huso]|uniref:Secreted protein n=1 Tax=Huso huso TaxID=61971 RepID=A0ABR0Y9H3_HUSHU
MSKVTHPAAQRLCELASLSSLCVSLSVPRCVLLLLIITAARLSARRPGIDLQAPLDVVMDRHARFCLCPLLESRGRNTQMDSWAGFVELLLISKPSRASECFCRIVFVAMVIVSSV